jgi:hypothetical protein
VILQINVKKKPLHCMIYSKNACKIHPLIPFLLSLIRLFRSCSLSFHGGDHHQRWPPPLCPFLPPPLCSPPPLSRSSVYFSLDHRRIHLADSSPQRPAPGSHRCRWEGPRGPAGCHPQAQGRTMEVERRGQADSRGGQKVSAPGLLARSHGGPRPAGAATAAA